MNIVEKVEALPPDITNDNVLYKFLLQHENVWTITYISSDNIIFKQFIGTSFETVVLYAYEWFRNNCPNLIEKETLYINGRKERKF